MNIKKWWKKLEYWKKGGIVGGLIGCFVLVLMIGLGIGLRYGEASYFLLKSIGLPFFIGMVLATERGYTELGGMIPTFIVGTVIYMLVGGIIALIIKKLKKK